MQQRCSLEAPAVESNGTLVAFTPSAFALSGPKCLTSRRLCLRVEAERQRDWTPAWGDWCAEEVAHGVLDVLALPGLLAGRARLHRVHPNLTYEFSLLYPTPAASPVLFLSSLCSSCTRFRVPHCQHPSESPCSSCLQAVVAACLHPNKPLEAPQDRPDGLVSTARRGRRVAGARRGFPLATTRRGWCRRSPAHIWR